MSAHDGVRFTAERWPPWRQGMLYDAGLLFLTDVGVVGDHRIAVLVPAIKVERLLLARLADRRAGIFVPADHLFLKVDFGSIPMLE